MTGQPRLPFLLSDRARSTGDPSTPPCSGDARRSPTPAKARAAALLWRLPAAGPDGAGSLARGRSHRLRPDAGDGGRPHLLAGTDARRRPDRRFAPAPLDRRSEHLAVHALDRRAARGAPAVRAAA